MAGGEAKGTDYRTIDAENVIDTARKLEVRIAERFPQSGLRKVSRELIALGRADALARSEELMEFISGAPVAERAESA